MWYSIALFILISIISYYKVRCLIHPSVIVSGVWAILIIVYNFAQDTLYPLSRDFYLALNIWVIPFCVFALLPYNKCIKIGKHVSRITPNYCLLKYIIPIFIVINIFGIYKYYTIGGGLAYSFISSIKDANNNVPPIFAILQYLYTFSLVIYTVCMIDYDRLCVKRNIKKIFIIFSFTLFCWAVVLSNKTGFVQLLVVSFVSLYYRRRIKLKHYLITLCFAVIGILALQALREKPVSSPNKEMDYERFVLIYTLSPLAAFDMQLHGEVTFPPNKTFRIVDAIKAKLGLAKDRGATDDRWVDVPVPTNVFTVMHSFHSDFGYLGIFIFATLLGFFWGVLFSGIQYQIEYRAVIYTIFAHTLILQFFADYIFTFLSVTIQVFVITFILFVRFNSKGIAN